MVVKDICVAIFIAKAHLVGVFVLVHVLLGHPMPQPLQPVSEIRVSGFRFPLLLKLTEVLLLL